MCESLFLNEGVDEQVLNELKQLWENKLQQSRAIDVIPTDVNVRVSLTYPHTSQTASASSSQSQARQQQHQQQQQQQAQAAPKQTTQSRPQQHVPQPVTAAHIIRNQAGQQQLVYVSQHPTLGHVGPMTGAAAQAAMALQNPAGRGQRTIIQQPIVGLPGQVIHVQQAAQAGANIYQPFQGHVAALGQRVIYAPATSAPPVSIPVPASSQPQGQKPPTRIIQVDGANDFEEAQQIPSTSLPKSRKKTRKRPEIILQFDGPNDSESEDEEDEEDYDNIPVAGVGGAGGGDLEETEGEEEEPLNSEDDVSDEEQTDLFDTDNVVVCQYEKIARTRNRWKFHLKDGIMNLNSKDFVFHKGNGDAEW